MSDVSEDSPNVVEESLPHRPSFFKSKTFVFSLGMLVSLVCLAWVFSRMFQEPGDWEKFLFAFRNADYRSLPVILITLSAFYVLKAWRWRLLLIPVGNYQIRKDLLPAILIGFGVNNVLPARMGEIARCVAFSREQKLAFSTTVSSVVLERFFDLIGVLFYLTLGVLCVEGLPAEVAHKAKIAAVFGGIGTAGGIAYLIWTDPVLRMFERVLGWIPFLPQKFVDKICRFLENGAAGLAALRSVRLVVLLLGISLLKWGLNGFLVFLSLWSFDLPASLMISFIVLGVVAFGVSAPSSPGYFGVMQVCFELGLVFFVGADRLPSIIAASFYFQLTQWVPVTSAGLFYLFRSGLRLSEISAKRDARADAEGAITELPRVPA